MIERAREFLVTGWYLFLGIVIWGFCLAAITIIIVATVAAIKSLREGGKK
jgi:hypothetical protein